MGIKIIDFGRSGMSASNLGLGCMGMSAFYGETNEKESLAAIDLALEKGINFFDTAEIYGPFKNEILLAKAMKGRRDKFILATKTGIEIKDDGTFVGVNGRPEYIKKAVDRSLKHLETDYIDLYYIHRIDPNTPIEESAGAMADLVKSGKIKYYGLSEASPSTIRKANSVYPVTALQTEYSLFERSVEDNGILDTVRELGITFVAYSPLGRGIISGKISSTEDLAADDWRRSNPRFQGENFEKNMELVADINKIAESRKVTPAQLALAWVLNKGVAAIPGTKRRTYLQENIDAAEIQLSGDEMIYLESLVPKDKVSGTRYPEAGMTLLNG